MYATSSVTLSPTTLSFGQQVVGFTGAAKTATLKNVQTAPLTITSITLTGPFAQSGGTCPISPAQLGKGASCTILVTYTPTAVGPQSGTLKVTDSASNSPQSSTLAGTGVAQVTLSPTKLTYAALPVGETSPPQTVTLTNNQGIALNITSVATTGDYAVASNGCTGTIPALGTCVVGVTFSPRTTGTRTGMLSFTDDAGNTPQKASLTGTGQPPALLSIAVTPANLVIYVNSTQQYTATGTYSNNTTKDLTTTVTWTTSPLGIASITSGGLATGVSQGLTTVTASLGAVTGSTQLTVNQVFVPTGSLNTARYYHTATILNNGNVVFIGGIGPIPGGTGALGTLNSAEVYSPGTGMFTNTGIMHAPRSQHTATLLNTGAVLITGGSGGAGALATSEEFNITSGLFYVAGSMHTARYGHTATILPGGTVLVAGGINGTTVLSSAEIFNPVRGTFLATTNSMNAARFGATATLLPNGLVLIAGGADNNGPIASAELYDPVAGTFTLTTNSLNVARSNATATVLNNGLVLIANGYNYSVTGPLTSAEVYDPVAGTFTLTGSEASTGYLGTATLLNNGLVLIAGSTLNAAPCELFSVVGNGFNSTSPLLTPRDLNTSTLLGNQTVLVAGGHSNLTNTVLAAAEVYEPDVLIPAGLVSISITPVQPTMNTATSQVFIATGTFSDNSTQQLASVTWTSSNPAAATISNDVTNPGVAYAIAAGTTIVSACTGSLCGADVVTVVAPPH